MEKQSYNKGSGPFGDGNSKPLREPTDEYRTVESRRKVNKSLLKAATNNASQVAASRISQYSQVPRTPLPKRGGLKELCKPVAERNLELQEAQELKLVPRSCFKPGVILRTVVHDPDFLSASRRSDDKASEISVVSSHYGNIHSKVRN